MTIEEVLPPLRAVNVVYLLRVQPHKSREGLSYQENKESSAKGGAVLPRRGGCGILRTSRCQRHKPSRFNSIERVKYLGLGIGPSCYNHAKGQEDHRNNLNFRILLPINIPRDHGGYASPRPQYDMHRNGDIITEGMIVQEVDAEEKHDIHNPAA